MYSGTCVAVVCTPVGEIPSVLTDGVHARFVEPGNVAMLSQALRDLLQQPQQLAQLQRSGRALYLAQFSIARFFDNVARVHQRHFGTAAAPGTQVAKPEEAR